jgi:putative FmdB family regulatory protein
MRPGATGTLTGVPVYEYRCHTCDDVFEVRRPMSESSAPADCPSGHADTVRLLSVFASAGASASGEQAAAAPRPVGGCGAGCACAH